MKATRIILSIAALMAATACATPPPPAPPADPGPGAWVERRDPDRSVLARLDAVRTELDDANLNLDAKTREVAALGTANQQLRLDLANTRTEAAAAKAARDEAMHENRISSEKILAAQLSEAQLRRRLLEILDAETKGSEESPSLLERRMISILLGELDPVPMHSDEKEER